MESDTEIIKAPGQASEEQSKRRKSKDQNHDEENML